MKGSKRFLALLLSVIMIFSFVGCDVEKNDYDNSSAVVSSTNSSESLNESSDNETSQKPESSSSQNNKPTEVGTESAKPIDPKSLPAYSGTAYTVVNNNLPNFSSSELTTIGYEKYSTRDSLGRCGYAIASCGKEIMPRPDEKRGSISSITPTGWIQKSYSGISGGYLWNRCHLIGWQLSAENANRENLITGTRYMNINGMLPFENMVADYIKETGNHVAYRITPIFEGKNLVCSGVQMEAYSVEDNGDGICFNVYCYNVQPGITINYVNGDSSGPSSNTTSSKPSNEQNSNSGSNGNMVWIPNTGSKYHSYAGCSNMKNPKHVSMSDAIEMGYGQCKKCW